MAPANCFFFAVSDAFSVLFCIFATKYKQIMKYKKSIIGLDKKMYRIICDV